MYIVFAYFVCVI